MSVILRVRITETDLCDDVPTGPFHAAGA